MLHRESCVPEGVDDPCVPGAVSSACPGGGGRSLLPPGKWSDDAGGPALVASVDGAALSWGAAVGISAPGPDPGVDGVVPDTRDCRSLRISSICEVNEAVASLELASTESNLLLMSVISSQVATLEGPP